MKATVTEFDKLKFPLNPTEALQFLNYFVQTDM